MGTSDSWSLLLRQLLLMLALTQTESLHRINVPYLGMIQWQTTQKSFINSESSGGFFWKLFPVQRERRGQHQLIVNWEDANIRFSNGSIGL
jgi:hypothetical protein